MLQPTFLEETWKAGKGEGKNFTAAMIASFEKGL